MRLPHPPLAESGGVVFRLGAWPRSALRLAPSAPAHRGTLQGELRRDLFHASAKRPTVGAGPIARHRPRAGRALPFVVDGRASIARDPMRCSAAHQGPGDGRSGGVGPLQGVSVDSQHSRDDAKDGRWVNAELGCSHRLGQDLGLQEAE
jgi:hypothetical protein